MSDTNKISSLFNSDGRKVTSSIRNRTSKLKSCIISSIVGTYATKIYGDYLFKPLLTDVGFDPENHSDQVRQMLYKNFDTRRNMYDCDGRVYLRNRVDDEVRVVNNASTGELLSIDSPVKKVCDAVKVFCPPAKDDFKSRSVFSVCCNNLKVNFSDSRSGDNYYLSDISILLACQYSLPYIMKIVGIGASEYFENQMTAKTRYLELHPDAKSLSSFSYDSPLRMQEDMLNGHISIRVRGPENTTMDLMTAVETLWRSYAENNEIDSETMKSWIDVSMDGYVNDVVSRVGCLAAIASTLEFDASDPNLFILKYPDFRQNKPQPTSKERLDLLQGLCKKQYRMISKMPRVCLDHLKELHELYCDVNQDTVENIVVHILEHRDVIISADAGWGKSSTLLLTYMMMAESENGPIPFLLNTSRLGTDVEASGDAISVPLSLSNSVTLHENDDVVLFIDSIDEFFRPDAIELRKILEQLSDHTLILAGRTQISDNLCEWIDLERIKILPGPTDYITAMIEKYCGDNSERLREFVVSNDLRNPMMIALACRYVEPYGGVVLWTLYDGAARRMILEKLEGIRRVCPDADEDMISSILEEYAWLHYHDFSTPTSYNRKIAETLNVDTKAVNRTISSFTDQDGRFMHATLQDYFVSRWVFRQASLKSSRPDLYTKLLGTDVQRMIGSRLSIDESASKSLIAWYEHEIGSKDSRGMNDIQEAIVLCYLARILIAGHPDTEPVRKLDRMFRSMVDSNSYPLECPQMMVLCDALTQKGDMQIERQYVELLKNSPLFGMICRKTYLSYSGDIDLKDVNENYSDVQWCGTRNLLTMFVRVLESKELRYKFLTRPDMVILTQIIENNYDVDPNLLNRILKNLDDLMEELMANLGFVSALDDSEVKREVYWSGLEETVCRLKMTIKHKITADHSNITDDNTIR